MAQLMNIRLSRFDAQPWGFRLQGGKDFGTPLVVQKVNGGSLAEQAGLLAGDSVIKVNNLDVFNMRHKDAQDFIVRSGNTFDLTIQRGGGVWRPAVTPTGSLPSPSSHIGNNISPVTKTSLSHRPQEVHHIGSGYNNAARPFSSVNGNDGQVKSIVNKQYNTPVGIYSEEAIAETLSAQAEVLAGGVLGVNFKKNEKIYSGANSEVLKMLHEQENEPEPASDYQQQSQPQQQQHQQHQQQLHSPNVTKHVNAPIDRPIAPNTGGLPTGQNICTECERLIVGVFVRIKDKNLHAECFKCATCGTNLKNQGYYNFNNKLYCEIHARMAAMNNPPKGTEGYTPVPIKPTAKLSANTISAALDAHTHHQYNGSSNHETSHHTHSRTSSTSSSIGGNSSSTTTTTSSLSPNKSISSPEKLSPSHSRQSSESGGSTILMPGNPPPLQHQYPHYPSTISPTLSSPPPPPPLPPEISQTVAPPSAGGIIHSSEIVINHKANGNDTTPAASNARKYQNQQQKQQHNGYNNGDEHPMNNGRNNGMPINNGGNDDGDVASRNGHSPTMADNRNGVGSGSGPSDLPSVLSPATVYNQFLKIYANKIQNDFLDGGSGIDTKKSPTKIATAEIAEKINESTENRSTKMTSTPLPVTSYTENLDSIYGTIRPKNTTKNPDEEFQYVTLDGSVIRSVVAPGKGIKTNYKLNTGYGGPKPFNTSSPMSPQMRGPQSPSTYPPPTNMQNWDQPRSQPSRPQTNPYATLPRSAGSQEENQQQNYAAEQEHHDRSIFEEDIELIEANRPLAGHFAWPPPSEEDRNTPTATPLYIAPPETQHIVPKTLTTQQQQQWQSRSAPELAITSGQQKQVEIESSSDSYTSTSTTTTTTSEEYHRMYQAQVQAYQMQQAYEQYGSEMDYHMDIDLAAMHQDQSYSSAMDYYSSGRRSAHECVDYLAGPVSTYHLIDMVRAVTPKPDTPPLKATKKVEFSDEIQVKKEERIVPIQTEVTETQTENEDTIEQRFEETDEQNVDELRVQPVTMEELTDHRKFTATPEIKIEIPPVKSIPPTNIPNPVPKEWISPMVRALTTAPDKPVEIPESLAELTVVESAQFKEEKTVKFQDPPENQDEIVAVKPEVLRESPPKGSFIAKTMTTAPKDSVQFASKLDDTISLPEETEPYMPPPMDMKPYYREDYRPKSPFLTALTVAPDRPYTPYNKQDVCSQLLDLPNPKEKLTMVDALTVASTRCYTPLNPENAATLIEDEKSKKSTYEFFSQQENEVIECQIQKSDMEECNRQLSAFANVNGSNGLCPFQPRRESLTSTASNVIPPARHNSLVPSVQNLVDQRDSLQSPFCRSTKMQSISSNHCHQKSEHSMHQSCASSTKTISYNGMTHKQTHHAMAAEHKNSQETEQKLSFPPPPPPPPPQPSSGHKKTTYSSGLHKPESIPQYQRNWTVLPSQRPVRTPEPPELRENVPLAFIETPRELTPSIDPSPITVPIINSTTTNATTALAQHNLAAFTATKASEQPQQQYQKIEKPKATLPIIVTENSAPVTMAFQSLDVPHEDAHPRPFTPSLINKPAPIIPFYQTPEKLVFEECPIATGRAYDPLAPSPLPDRARSPAPGPPPNPLSAIRAPRMKDTEPSYRPTQQGSITTGQSYFGTTAAQYQTQECGQTVSHCQTGYQSGSQKFIDRPESVQLKKIGDTLIQTRSKESQLSEENRSATQTTSTSQVGNMQIERRRKVVEEFEHTQTAKSMEIRTGHEQTSKGHYGKTGFVANQTRRLSGLEQEISSMSSQSQAISARAANLSSPTTIFPHYKSPEPVSMFPLKTAMPPNDEPQRPAYVVSANATNKMVSGPPSTEQTYTATNMGSRAYPHATLSTTATYGAAQRSITSATSQYSSSAAAASSFDVSSLNNFSSSASAPPPPSKLTNPPSVPAYKPPVPFSSVSGPSNLDTAGSSYSQPLSLQQPGSFLTTNQQPPAPQSTNSVAFTPTTISSSAVAPAPNESSAYKAPPPPSSNSFTPNVVNDSSAASAGPSKSGAFGATSAPKRGRGILNKAVGPGGRVPMCGCCQRQIRGPFITALGRIWCPEHFVCVNANCRRALQDIGFVEEKGELYCEFCFEKYLAPTCSRCNGKIKGDCLNAIGKHYHPECFTCSYCGRLFGNRPFFLEEGEAYCEADWNELFTTKCFACGFPVEAGDRWVEALNHNYHSQCFNCTMCKKNLEGQSFYNKGGRPFCKNHAR